MLYFYVTRTFKTKQIRCLKRCAKRRSISYIFFLFGFRMEVAQNFNMNSKHSVTGFRMSQTELIGYGMISFLVVLWCHYKWTRRRFESLAAKMTGPPAYPIIGAGLEFVGTPQRKRAFIYSYFSYLLQQSSKRITLIITTMLANAQRDDIM